MPAAAVKEVVLLVVVAIVAARVLRLFEARSHALASLPRAGARVASDLSQGNIAIAWT